MRLALGKKAKVSVQATLGTGLALSKPAPEPRRSPRLDKRKGGPSADLQAVAARSMSMVLQVESTTARSCVGCINR